jgi:hypothetical protein
MHGSLPMSSERTRTHAHTADNCIADSGVTADAGRRFDGRHAPNRSAIGDGAVASLCRHQSI